MYTKDEEDLIVLSSFKKLSVSAQYAGYTELSGGGQKKAIKKVQDGVYNKVRELFYDGGYRRETLSKLDSLGVECLTLASPAYPKRLKQIPNPPVTLFMQGDKTLLHGNAFGIVGSRRTPPDMLVLCKGFAGDISQKFTVITGSADGADAAALTGAQYRAVSVVAGGPDVFLQNAVTAVKKTAERGLVISESFPGTPALRYLFPLRNRIIAGLSEGLLVVSAAEKSGALITAGYAFDYGRKVYAFPYGIGVAQGAGCNNLIKKGAALVQNTLDIFADFGLDLKTAKSTQLTEEEAEVYRLLKESGSAFLPQLAEKLGRPVFKLIPVLSALEIKGKAVRLGGNRYSAV